MVDKLVERLKHHPKLNNRLFWLSGISDEYLEKIYDASTCLIAASEGEGFGLPLIEAAQHKLPIIARDIPVFREVAGEHAFYFQGKEPDDLADAVKKWLELYKSGDHPRSDDMPWLTWEQSAEQLKNILVNKG
jgi:glycosyltransferase involved in cell wall biosynthesis